MGKTKRCELWIGTMTNFFKVGKFDSIKGCRKYINECSFTCYKEIHVIDEKGNCVKILKH